MMLKRTAATLPVHLNAQGRVLTVLSPDGHVLQSNTYDADGRLLQRLDGVGSGVKCTNTVPSGGS